MAVSEAANSHKSNKDMQTKGKHGAFFQLGKGTFRTLALKNVGATHYNTVSLTLPDLVTFPIFCSGIATK